MDTRSLFYIHKWSYLYTSVISHSFMTLEEITVSVCYRWKPAWNTLIIYLPIQLTEDDISISMPLNWPSGAARK